MNEIKLKVVEAFQDDINKGIVRIDSSLMKNLEVKEGDIVSITGKKETYGIVTRGYPGDIGLNIIRMDGSTRKNAQAGIGEFVPVKKAEVNDAKKIVIAPLAGMIKAPSGLFKKGLLGRVVVKGNIISLGGSRTRRNVMNDDPMFRMLDQEFFGMGFGLSSLKFIVAETNPKGGPVMVTESTEIVVESKPVEIKEDIETLDVSYEDVGGLEEEVKKIREMVELPLKKPELFQRLGIEAPKGVLLHGPPGTGKTLLAKAVANETGVHFINMKPSALISGVPGATEKGFEKVFQDASDNAPSIIFIDEIDSFGFKRESRGANEFLNTPVIELLRQMDGLKNRGQVIVIAATNRVNSLDPALRRPGRFDREIEVGVPSRAGRLNILKIHTRTMPLDKKVNLKKLAEITHGFVGADLASLAKEAAMSVIRRVFQDIKLDEKKDIPKELLEKLIVKEIDFAEALKFVRPSAMREVFVEVPTVKWDDVGGLDKVKQQLKEAVEWPLNNPEVFKRMGIKPPRGVLLYGPPGTGKTLLAKAVATESKANFISVKGPEMLSKWVNETPQMIKKIFLKGRQTSPSILFFDEIDSITKRRSTDSKEGMSAVNQLLTEMDGIDELKDIIIIGATNRPDIMDPALLRPGRFDRIILVQAPTKDAREKILKIHTKAMPLAKDVDLKKMAIELEGYVGADIEAVCREAAIIALREDLKAKIIHKKDFDEALKVVRPSVEKDTKEKYAKLQDGFSAAKAKEINEQPNYFG